MAKRSDGSGRPLYMISVAAELTGLHPQTLRVYERKALVEPRRSAGNTRLYSDDDIERLRLITRLTDEGINLAGGARILELRDEMRSMERRIRDVQRRAEEFRQEALREIEKARRAGKAEIVHVRRGGLARRERP
jgi:MerR family transcriptional regulator/heat shock protein HspR